MSNLAVLEVRHKICSQLSSAPSGSPGGTSFPRLHLLSGAAGIPWVTAPLVRGPSFSAFILRSFSSLKSLLPLIRGHD